MAAAAPLELLATPPGDPATLSPEDAAYLREFAMFLEEEERRHPGLIDREIAAARMYGTDFEREREDARAGRHPHQQPG